MCKLTDEHGDLLAAIDRLRVRARRKNRSRFHSALLSQAARDHQWIAHDGHFTEMSTPFTRRAAQLYSLFEALAQRQVSSAQRVELLMSVKVTIREYKCLVTQRLAALIDREVYLLNFGYPVQSRMFDGLRERIQQQFVLFCKTPEFNPEVTRYIRVPPNVKVLENKARICRLCRRALPLEEFPFKEQRSTMAKASALYF